MSEPPPDSPLPDPFEESTAGDGLWAFDQAQDRPSVRAGAADAAPAVAAHQAPAADGGGIVLIDDDGLDDFAPEPGRTDATPALVVVEPQVVAADAAEAARRAATWRVLRAAVVCAAFLAGHEFLLSDRSAPPPQADDASVAPVTESRAVGEARTTDTAPDSSPAPAPARAEPPVPRRVALPASEPPTSAVPASNTLAAGDVAAPPVPIDPQPSSLVLPEISAAMPAIDRVAADASPPEPAPAVVPAVAPDEGPARPAPAVPAAAISPAPRDTDHRAIEGVLGQYRQAFNRLDASAASAVWPSVNERTLARAFESLEGQDVSFDRCRIDVAAGQAEAACSGHARYVPKVGNRTPRAEAREWTFTLRKAESGWLIDRVDAR